MLHNVPECSRLEYNRGKVSLPLPLSLPSSLLPSDPVDDRNESNDSVSTQFLDRSGETAAVAPPQPDSDFIRKRAGVRVTG